MALAPAQGQARHLVEGTRLLEQVPCTRDDLQLLIAAQRGQRFFVEPDHRLIVAPDDRERRRGHIAKRGRREVGSAAARYHRSNRRFEGGRDQRRRRAGAGTVVSNRQGLVAWLFWTQAVAARRRSASNPTSKILHSFGGLGFRE